MGFGLVTELQGQAEYRLWVIMVIICSKVDINR